MENAAKALEMAAGVLLAVIIMSLVAYFFTTLSIWPEQEDEMETAEQLATFNLEYEVYEKKGMYGTDVISCLAKAQSNNEKYYSGGSWLSGQAYGQQHWVNVYVNLKSDLTEEMTTYHYNRDSAGIYQQIVQFNTLTVTMEDAGLVFYESPKGNKYTMFTESSTIGGGTVENTLNGSSKYINISSNYATEDGKTYNAALYEKSGDDINVNKETPLQILIETAGTNLTQIVYNKNSSSLTDWSCVEWKTALYDFKTRRFKCDKIKYNDYSGRVYELYFSEI